MVGVPGHVDSRRDPGGRSRCYPSAPMTGHSVPPPEAEPLDQAPGRPSGCVRRPVGAWATSFSSVHRPDHQPGGAAVREVSGD